MNHERDHEERTMESTDDRTPMDADRSIEIPGEAVT